MIEGDSPLDLCSVGTDHYVGMRRATESLINLGHTRIALITGGPRTRAGRERLRGLVAAFEAANLPLDPAMLRLESFAPEYGFRETQALLSLPSPPTALIARGNQLLASVLHAVRLKGLDVPRDLSIISSGDTELAQLATPSITIIRWDLGAVGCEAANLMIKLLRGDAPSGKLRVEVRNELVMRESCAPVSSNAPAPARGQRRELALRRR